MSVQDIANFMSLYQRAIDEAILVRDGVLDKIHPDLKINYRMYFQKGLELRISALRKGKTYDEIQGSALLDSWSDCQEPQKS